jgi:flagellar basal body-associated protein FliL
MANYPQQNRYQVNSGYDRYRRFKGNSTRPQKGKSRHTLYLSIMVIVVISLLSLAFYLNFLKSTLTNQPKIEQAIDFNEPPGFPNEEVKSQAVSSRSQQDFTNQNNRERNSILDIGR